MTQGTGGAGRFRTELPTMQVAANHVHDVNAAIQGQLSTLLARLEPLAGTWQGAAAGSFQVLKQRWHDDASALNTCSARSVTACSRPTGTTREPTRTTSRASPGSAAASADAAPTGRHDMPDYGHVLVTFGSLAEASADVDAVANQIDQQLADLRVYLAPLVASWEGTASADYQAKQNRWDGAIGDLNLVLREMARAVRTANDNYQLAESSNAAMWG